MYRLLVSGSRIWDGDAIVRMVILQQWVDHPDIVIVHGDCPRGVDAFAKQFALEYGLRQEAYPADWEKHGKAAGHIRNKAMVDTSPDYAVFFIQGESRGTKNCLEHARKAGIPHVIYGEQPQRS